MENRCELSGGGEEHGFFVESAYARTDFDEHDYVELFSDEIYLAAPIPPEDVPCDDPEDPESPVVYSRLNGKTFSLAKDMVGQRCFIALPEGECPVMGGTLTFTAVAAEDGTEPTWAGTLSVKVKVGKASRILAGRFATSFLPAEL